MGFTSRKTGNFKEAENYYLTGLDLIQNTMVLMSIWENFMFKQIE